MQIETEIKKLRAEIRELKELLMKRNVTSAWVKQDQACVELAIKPRRLRDIRIHTDKNGNKVGVIRWRKGRGKTIEYYKPDLEKHLSLINVQ
jgi:hypothetical protein